MRILALLPDETERALRRALRPADTLRRVLTAESLAGAARTAQADAVVFDPTVLGDAEWMRLRPLLSDSNVAVLLYSELRTENLARLLDASAIGVHELLLRDVDDDVVTVRRRLDSLRQPEAPAALLSQLAPRLALLPPTLQGVAVPIFCAAPIPRWVDELTVAAGMPRRSMDRWMERAGLGGSATLLDVARLARVWAPIVDRSESAADVALELGYRRIRRLAEHTRRILGVTPTTLGAALTREAFVRRLVAHALRD